MGETPKTPLVAYWILREGNLELGFGYLFRFHDGRCMCIPTEETAEKQLSLSAGFQIDQSHLQEQPDTGADRKLYLYRVVLDAPLEASQRHQGVQGRFQAKG